MSNPYEASEWWRRWLLRMFLLIMLAALIVFLGFLLWWWFVNTLSFLKLPFKACFAELNRDSRHEVSNNGDKPSGSHHMTIWFHSFAKTIEYRNLLTDNSDCPLKLVRIGGTFFQGNYII